MYILNQINMSNHVLFINSPNVRGRHAFTVRPRSTSTTIRLPSTFFPSALLYAAIST